MDKLANYGSDDDYDDSPKSKRTENRSSTERSTQPCRQASSQVDVNYEEVQMELSEDSSSDTSSDRDDHPPSRSDKPKNSRHDDHDRKRYRDDDRHGKCAADDRHKDRESPKSRDYKSKRDDEDDRYRGRDDRHRERGRDDKHRDKYREDRGRDSRYRDDRRSKRSTSRERRSRSPRNHKNKSSRDGDSKGGAAYSRRYERASNKMAQLEKLGIEIKTPDCQFITPSDLQRSMDDQKHKGDTDKNRFFMPGITGRFREQIERRKLLWQKKEPEKKEVAVAPVVGTSVGSKVWESTTFAQDSDGKVASKFKRLMGIRETKEEPKSTTDILKKQEEMFSSMEQQYEVARTATHTMRGVGLGFGSFQR